MSECCCCPWVLVICGLEGGGYHCSWLGHHGWGVVEKVVVNVAHPSGCAMLVVGDEFHQCHSSFPGLGGLALRKSLSMWHTCMGMLCHWFGGGCRCHPSLFPGSWVIIEEMCHVSGLVVVIIVAVCIVSIIVCHYCWHGTHLW